MRTAPQRLDSSAQLKRPTIPPLRMISLTILTLTGSAWSERRRLLVEEEDAAERTVVEDRDLMTSPRVFPLLALDPLLDDLEEVDDESLVTVRSRMGGTGCGGWGRLSSEERLRD